MSNKIGQYWIPEQGAQLVDWWNRRSGQDPAVWTPEHEVFLSKADLVHNYDLAMEFIHVGHRSYALAAFLFVCELWHDHRTGSRIPNSSIYKSVKEPRWSEALALQIIKDLGLPFHFDVISVDAAGVTHVRSTRTDASSSENEEFS